MSRVFEALTRASHEKERTVESAVKEIEQNAELSEHRAAESLPSSPSSAVLLANQNGQSHEWTALPPKPSSPKPWRERIEELVFGWDLRRYATHPIIALEEESPASEQYKILREQVRRL